MFQVNFTLRFCVSTLVVALLSLNSIRSSAQAPLQNVYVYGGIEYTSLSAAEAAMRNNGATDDYATKAREALKRTGFTSVNGKDYITYTAETESAEASLVLSNFKTGGVTIVVVKGFYIF